MTTFNQIPDEYLFSDRLDIFVDWLFKYQLSWWNIRGLILQWSYYTERKLTAAEWSKYEDRWIKQNAR